MKKALFLTASILLFSTTAYADNFSGSVTMKGVSQYLGSNGDVFDEDAVGQHDVKICHKSGFCFNTWVSHDGDDVWIGDFGDEIDFTASYSNAVNGFNYSVTAALFVIADPVGADFGDVIDLNVRVGYPISLNEASITPYVQVHQYLPTKNDLPDDGNIIRLGSQYSISVSSGVRINGFAESFYDTGAFGYDNGWLFGGQLSVDFDITENLNAGPFIKFYTPLSDLEDGDPKTKNDGREAATAIGVRFTSTL